MKILLATGNELGDPEPRQTALSTLSKLGHEVEHVEYIDHLASRLSAGKAYDLVLVESLFMPESPGNSRAARYDAANRFLRNHSNLWEVPGKRPMPALGLHAFGAAVKNRIPAVVVFRPRGEYEQQVAEFTTRVLDAEGYFRVNLFCLILPQDTPIVDGYQMAFDKLTLTGLAQRIGQTLGYWGQIDAALEFQGEVPPSRPILFGF